MRLLHMALPVALAAGMIAALDAHAGAPDRRARIVTSKVLRACIWPDYYGITYRNPKTRQLSGIDITPPRREKLRFSKPYLARRHQLDPIVVL